MYIRWDYENALLANVGNKTFTLGQLKKLGIKVPHGFAITTQAFLDFLINNNIYNQIKSLLAKTLSLKDKSRQIANLFTAQISDKIAEEISKAKNELKGLLAVRSSSTIEDTKEASFAGLYDTFLQLKSSDEVLKAVKKCWQSAFGFRALAYLKKLDLRMKDPAEIAMGVLVQKMITQRFAGVMFTVNPVTGDASKILIEYSDRPAKLVTLGEITPNPLLVDKITRQIDKEKGTWLDERYIYQLVELGRKIERHFGCYQDIEWVVDRDSEDIIILQARPETIWNERHKNPFHQPGQSILSFIPEVKV